MITVIVPVVALLFTVAAFWWIFLRPGRLSVTPPATYATPSGPALRLRFPFVFVNHGAAPCVVADLRLRVAGNHEFHWASIRSKVSPSRDDFVDSAGAFAVRGQEARQMILEFGQVPPAWRPEPGKSYAVQLDVMAGSGEWGQILEFSWFAPKTDDLLEAGVALRNTPSGGPLL